MVAGGVGLGEAAFEPGGAAVEQGDAVFAEVMSQRPPVDGGCAAGEAVGDELLRAGEDADVEGLRLEDGGARRRLALEADEDKRRIERDRDQAARGETAELVAES